MHAVESCGKWENTFRRKGKLKQGCSLLKDKPAYTHQYTVCICVCVCVLLSTAEPSSFDDECDDDGIAIILIQLTCNPLTVHVSGGLTSISVPLWMTASPALPVVVRSSCDTGGHKLWSDKSVQVDRERERECERGRTSSFFFSLNVSLSFSKYAQVETLWRLEEWRVESGMCVDLKRVEAG